MGERPQFATPADQITAAFDGVMAGVSPTPKKLAAMRSAFIAADWTGRSGQEQRVVDIYMGADWQWPWLEACAATLAQHRLWPAAWTTTYAIEAPLRWHMVDPLTRNALLLDTVFTAINREKAIAHLPEMDDVFRGELRGGYLPCLAEAHFLDRYGNAVAARDYTQLPPYFPGDHIHIATPRRKRR